MRDKRAVPAFVRRGFPPGTAGRLRGVLAALMAGTAVLSLSAAGSVRAQSAATVAQLDIPAQSLADALVAFSRQTRIEIFVSSELAAGRRSSPVSGAMAPQAALQRLLAGTGLGYSFTNATTVRIVDPSAQALVTDADGAVVLDTIDVTGNSGSSAGGVGDPYATAAPVSSVSSETFRERFGGDANQALRNVAGAFTRQGSDQPGYAVNIRGMSGMGRVNSMIDGVPQTFRNAAGHAAYGGTLTYIHPELLAGIDITRGAVPGAHGAGTLSGAANFRSLSVDDVLVPGQTLGGLTRFRAGTNGQDSSGLLAAAGRADLFPDGSGEVSVLAAWAESNNTNHRTGEGVFLDPPVMNSPSGRVFKLGIAPDDVHSLNFGYVDYANLFRASGYDWNLDNKTYSLNYRFNPDSDLFDVRLDAYFNETGMHYTGSDGNVAAYVNREIESYSSGGSLTNTSAFDLSDELFLKLHYGASYNKDDYRVVSGGASRGSNAPGVLEKASVFADATLSWGMFDFVAGLRYDRYDLSGTRQASQGGTGAGWIEECPGPEECPAEDVSRKGGSLDPKFSVVARPADWLQLYATYAHTFRPPVSQEVFWGLLPNDPTSEGSGIHNNIGLRPERSRGWDLGFNIRKDDLLFEDDAAFLKVGYFNNKITDYITAHVIDIDRCAGPAECYIGSATWVNVPGTTTMSGVEIEGGYDTGFAYANLSYTRSQTRLPIGPLIGGDTSLGDIDVLPKDYGMIDVGMRLMDRRLTLGAKARYVGASSYVSTSREGEDAWETVPAYTLFDLYGTYRLTEHSQLFFNVENLTNERYRMALSSDSATKFTGRGRTFSAGFSAKIGVPGEGGAVFPRWTDPATGYDWSGAFVGLESGYSAATGQANGTLEGSVFGFPFSSGLALDRQAKGLSGNLTAGYNHHTSSPLVIGADVSFGLVDSGDVEDNAKIDSNDPLLPPFTIQPTVSSALNWHGSARARVGIAFDRVMPYLAAGVAVASYDHDMSFFIRNRPNTTPPATDHSGTYTGWTIGAGIDHAVTDNLILKAEYRYSDFGSKSYSVPGSDVRLDLTSSEMRFGLSYKF